MDPTSKKSGSGIKLEARIRKEGIRRGRATLPNPRKAWIRTQRDSSLTLLLFDRISGNLAVFHLTGKVGRVVDGKWQ